MHNFVKNFEIIFGCVIYYIFLNKIKITKEIVIKTIVGVLSLTIVGIFLDKTIAYLTYYIIFLLLFVFEKEILYRQKSIEYSTLISFAVSYALFSISVLIASSISLLFSSDFSKEYSQYICLIITEK